MRIVLLPTAMGLLFLGASIVQSEPTLFKLGPGGVPLPPNRDVCWSEPPDLEGILASSEVIGEHGLETQAANDFVFEVDRTIQRVRWWGGYYSNIVACDPGMVAPGFHLRFYTYEREPCRPDEPGDDPYTEYFVQGPAGETLVGCIGDVYPLYRYETDVVLPIAGGVRYWFSAQMANHDYPPQWGRLAAGTITGCESVVGPNGWLEQPWWQHPSEVFGFPVDFSQEFECDTPVPVQQTSWGKVRALYR